MLQPRDFFQETQEAFTVYVVEQRFVVGRGLEYFKSYRGKENYISSDKAMKKNISKVLRWIQKNTPNVAELIKVTLQLKSPLGIVDVISTLSKLFAVNEHQAVGPEVLDPIIIQEGEVSRTYLAQLIALHKDSILQPAIIILLKDNNFERARELLSKCPNGMNIKMIRNSGATEIYKVINTGADNIDEFLDLYSRQCFSTCSKTKRGILLNEEWAENSLVRLYSPSIFKLRTNLLFDEKDRETQADINSVINQLYQQPTGMSANDDKLIQSLICMSKLFRVYCNDAGGQDIYEALDLAKDLNNQLLLAHVYRYSFFLKDYSFNDRQQMLLDAYSIFQQNNVEDHAIYCMNNYLNQQMYGDHLNLRPYKELLEEAIYNVPGLVGMSYIYNNTGVASLYSGKPEEAIEYFNKGLNYARERIVPWLGLQNNLLIAKDNALTKIDDHEIQKLVNQVFSTMGLNRLPFISSNIISNCLVLAFKHSQSLGEQILREYPIVQLYNNALTPNQMGSGSLCRQLSMLSRQASGFDWDAIHMPNQTSTIEGIRLRFIERYGLNPMIFHTWL